MNANACLVVGFASVAMRMAAVSASAATVDFPAEGGDYDLSSAAAWGGSLPAESDAIELNKSYGKTLAFSGNCAFDSLFFTKNSSSNLIEVTRPDVVIRLKGDGGSYPGIRSRAATSAHLVLRGGTYDLCGKGGVYASSPADNSDTYSKLTLDGVTITNAATVSVANASRIDGNRLVLTNGANVTAANGENFFNCTSVRSGGTAIVSGGSRLTFTGGRFIPFRKYTTGGTLLVTGEGSVITNASSSTDRLFYDGVQDCTLRVANGASVYVNGPYDIGYGSNSGNLMEVSNGGLLRFLGSSSVGLPYGSGKVNLKVLSGGTFVSSTKITFQKSGNLILVSNGTFRATLNFGGSKNTVRVQGENAVYSPSGTTLFDNGATGSLLEFGAGATWSVQDYLYLGGSSAYSNTLAVIGGAELKVKNFPGISYSAGKSIYGYTFRVADEGALSVNGTGSGYGHFTLTGWGNTVVLSNGTLSAVNGIDIGALNSNGSATEKAGLENAGHSLVFQGAHPRATSYEACSLRRGTVLRFEVPQGGYPADAKPLFEVYSLQSPTGDPMKLELTGIDENFIQGLDHAFDVKLINQTKRPFSQTLGFLADQVAAINATLPKRVKLYLTPDKYELHLSAKPETGLVLIVR